MQKKRNSIAGNKSQGNSKTTKVSSLKEKDYRTKVIFLLLGLIVLTSLTYSPLTGNKFLNWDDNLYVTENNNIKDFSHEHVKNLFTHNFVSNYLPLTMLSYSVDYKISGLNPKVFIISNLLFHVFNVLFVFWLIFLITNSFYSRNLNHNRNPADSYYLAFIVAALFALHPLNVESVAWVSERKNLLYSFFYLPAIICYVKYAEKGRAFYYVISLLLFICSLLSKGVAVSLTLSILAIDYLFFRKILSKKVLLEKIPFLILSLFFGIITILGQRNENELVGAVKFPFYEQISFASFGFINYIFKLLIPFRISAYYSYPMKAGIVDYASLLLTITICLLLILYRKKMNRLIIFSILFFLINIIFLIQIVPVGNAMMADRYIYLSSIGFFLLVAVYLVDFAKRYSLIYFLLGCVLLVFGVVSNQRIKVWNNSLTFWNDVIAKDKHIPRAWSNRGICRNEKGDFSGAIDDFNNAIAIMPDYQEAYNNRGIAYFNLKMNEQAIQDFTKAIKIDSTYSDAYYNRGTVRSKGSDLNGALQDLNIAIRMNPGKMEAYLNRADLKLKLNDYKGVIGDCQEVIKRNPAIPNAYGIMASAYYNSGDLLTSIDEYTKGIQLDPSNIAYYHNRGAAYFYSGKYREAINDMDIVLQNNAIGLSYYIRGMANIKLGNGERGCNDLNNALHDGLEAAGTEIKNYCR